MAIFDNAVNTTNPAVLLFNHQANKRGVLLGERVNPAVAFFTGQQAPYDKSKKRTLGDMPQGVKLKGGRKLEIKFAQQRSAPTGTGYGSGEQAATSPSPETKPRASTEIDIANYTESYYQDYSEREDFAGLVFKDQIPFLTQENDRIMEAWFTGLETALCGAKTVAPTTTQTASILNMLIGNTLGLIDRTLAENADMKATLNSATTAITLSALFTAIRHVTNRRGEIPLVMCASDVYGFLAAKIEAAAGHNATVMKADNLNYNGMYFQYRGVNIVEFPLLANGTCIVADPSTFAHYFVGGQVAEQFMPWMIDPGREAQYVAKFRSKNQLICTDPAKNYVFDSIAS